MVEDRDEDERDTAEEVLDALEPHELLRPLARELPLPLALEVGLAQAPEPRLGAGAGARLEGLRGGRASGEVRRPGRGGVPSGGLPRRDVGRLWRPDAVGEAHHHDQEDRDPEVEGRARSVGDELEEALRGHGRPP